ncbi:MAG: hypothetical protein ISR47_06510 [Rhodospirillales bacterium]|nr:hypothetical protein [Rhodospirillales bacterium]
MRKKAIPETVKDENLRIVLAREEKQHIRNELVNSRRSAFNSAKVLSIAVLAGFVFWSVLTFAGSSFEESTILPMIVTVVSIGFILLVPVLAVRTLLAVTKYRRYQEYERDLRSFLKKYNRAWDNV